MITPFAGDRAQRTTPHRLESPGALPPLNQDGYLPVGIHPCEWPEFSQRFGVGHRRAELLANMHRLLTQVKQHGFHEVFVGGSFVTRKPVPGDFDMTWRISGTQLGELNEVAPLLVDRDLQKRTLGGELMPTYPNSPGGGMLSFLQRKDGRVVGIVRLDLSSFAPIPSQAYLFKNV